ncbi:MAG: hypothetical protein LBR15_10800 [Methanobrevibacter sp.]|jgi:hypothetical protein|nr:hypothetical protein [Candidatus Methanovirga australis]
MLNNKRILSISLLAICLVGFTMTSSVSAWSGFNDIRAGSFVYLSQTKLGFGQMIRLTNDLTKSAKDCKGSKPSYIQCSLNDDNKRESFDILNEHRHSFGYWRSFWDPGYNSLHQAKFYLSEFGGSETMWYHIYDIDWSSGLFIAADTSGYSQWANAYYYDTKGNGQQSNFGYNYDNHMTKWDTTLEMNSSIDHIGLGENISIKGYLRDHLGRVKNSDVLVNISGAESDSFTIKTDNNGDFSTEYKPKNYGNHTINLTYNGDNSRNPSSISTTIKIQGIPTNINCNVPDIFNVNDYLSGTLNLTSNNILIPDTNLNVTVTNPEGLVNTTIVKNNGSSVDLSQLKYKFNTKGNYKLEITYNGDDTYEPSTYLKNVKVNGLSTSIGGIVPDIFNANDSLSGMLNLTNNNIFIPDTQCSVNITKPDGSDYSKIMKTDEYGGLDLSQLDYNFSDSGYYNLTVNYQGDTVYDSSNFNKRVIVIIPFDGELEPGLEHGSYRYEVHMNNTKDFTVDSAVFYNMTNALSGYKVDKIRSRFTKSVSIEDNILTINWDVKPNKLGTVLITVRKN